MFVSPECAVAAHHVIRRPAIRHACAGIITTEQLKVLSKEYRPRAGEWYAADGGNEVKAMGEDRWGSKEVWR